MKGSGWHALGACLSLVMLLQPVAAGRQTTASGQLAFLQPWFEPQAHEREQLARRAVVVRSLAPVDRQISVVAACAVAVSPERFVARVRALGETKPRALASGRFSTPPALTDLAALTLDPGDVDRLRRCRPGACALNLASEEMTALQRTLRAAPNGTPDVHDTFRGIVLERVRRYQAGGLEALPDYQDRTPAVRPAAILSELTRHLPYLAATVPQALAYVERYPAGDRAASESMLLWSKVTLNGKPVLLATHLAIFRPEPGPRRPDVLVAAKQIYASRYMNGELTLTMLFGASGGAPAHLVVVNRSHLDELGGLFTGLKRSVIEDRVREEAADALTAFRDRLERGA